MQKIGSESRKIHIQIPKLVLLQCFVNHDHLTFPEIQSHLRTRQYNIPESSIYRLLPQLEQEQLILGKVIHRLPITKTYSITPQGLREYHQILQILNLTDPILTPQNEEITVSTNGESAINIPISVQMAEDISDILRDVFLDDTPSEIELQRIQTGTKKVIKYIQRTFH